MRALVLAAALVFAPLAGVAQQSDRDRTLADIRQDLSVVYVEIQRLKRELSTTGGAGVNLQGSGIIGRVDALEAEVQRLTSDVEETRNLVERVVEDGTNRIGDLEFRLVELEGGDLGALGETTTLGGVELPPAAQSAPPAGTSMAGAAGTGGVELAIGEREAFDAGKAALESGDYQSAATQLGNLLQNYPGTPLTQQAQLLRGAAFEQMGQYDAAAQSYLESYSGSPDGPYAADALLRLGLAQRARGNAEAACITLGEVTSRYASHQASIEAQTARADLGCL